MLTKYPITQTHQAFDPSHFQTYRFRQPNPYSIKLCTRDDEISSNCSAVSIDIRADASTTRGQITGPEFWKPLASKTTRALCSALSFHCCKDQGRTICSPCLVDPPCIPLEVKKDQCLIALYKLHGVSFPARLHAPSRCGVHQVGVSLRRE